MPAKTIADAIHEFLAPVQPADCKHANLMILAGALKVSGPVVHRGQVVSAKDAGAEVQVDFEARPFTRVTATDTEAERDPADEELAAQWKLPLAKDVPLAAPKAAPAETAHSVPQNPDPPAKP